jgi:26S proteasome regulatory subunit N2
VYYQLQEYNESMVFALGAGKLFDIHKAAEFEETIMGKTYTTLEAAILARYDSVS